MHRITKILYKSLLLILISISLNASTIEDLSKDRYWHILLHYVDGQSEIDDAKFFFAKDGHINPQAELQATLDALINEERFDDNSSACRFPARRAWLKEKLDIKDFPEVTCKRFDLVMKKLDPSSATLIFPAAHINSPASMFGHTLLRINSSYNSRLLSYAVNYAADADPSKANGLIFAMKGLFGGYFGEYSLLPYYDKLKEYRDGESRDIWEYDLNFTKEETLRMFRHIWELNDTHSYYYFFTKNCSYNMLWFLESARPSINLRKHFTFQVIPLETIHAAKTEGIIEDTNFRPSKRSKLLKYEELLEGEYLYLPKKVVKKEISLDEIINDNKITLTQKQYILEASIEYLEYSYKRNNMNKDQYLEMFHKISVSRASLGQGNKLNFKTPPNPIDSHRALRISSGIGMRETEPISYIGTRIAYHDLEDSTYGFLRGTQIEFLNMEFSYNKENNFKAEDLTIISIVSLAQRSEFFDSLSWRTRFGFDRNSNDNYNANFIATLGAGYSWGNTIGYVYVMIDPFTYIHSEVSAGVGGSLGLIIDKSNHMSTNLELTSRLYTDSTMQNLVNFSQNFRLSQNFELKFKYNYIDREYDNVKYNEQTIKSMLNYYF